MFAGNKYMMNLSDKSVLNAPTHPAEHGVPRATSHTEGIFYQIPGSKVTVVVRLAGKVDTVNLQTAIDRIPINQPLLRAKADLTPIIKPGFHTVKSETFFIK